MYPPVALFQSQSSSVGAVPYLLCSLMCPLNKQSEVTPCASIVLDAGHTVGMRCSPCPPPTCGLLGGETGEATTYAILRKAQQWE